MYAELRKIYLMGSQVQSKAMRVQKRNLLVMKSIRIQKLNAEPKKVYFMGSDIQTESQESPKTYY
jgi:hypothetical protein